VISSNPDLADDSLSASLASINTSEYNNITNNTDIRQKGWDFGQFLRLRGTIFSVLIC
jgi:hypothetical protein